MFEGDSLSVVLWLAGGGLATMIGALTAAHGWRTKLLWTLTAAFALSLLAWIFTPAASPIIQALSPVVVALVESNALAMVLIVGVVALIQARRKPESPPVGQGVDLAEIKAPQVPPFAVAPGKQSKWAPDTSLADAFLYFAEHSGQRGYHDSVADVLRKFVSSLRDPKVTSWGKAHPSDSEDFQIKPQFWTAAEITLKTNYVFSGHLNCAAFEVRLSKAELELVWPPNDPSRASA